MPAMKSKLRETEVMQLVSLVRDFRDGRQVVSDEPAEAAESLKSAERKRTASRLTARNFDSPRAPEATTARVNAVAEAGRGLFQRFCIACHEIDGRGSRMREQVPSIPDFTSPVWQARRSNAQIITTILEGKGTNMPSLRGKLDERQVRNILAHLRTFAPMPPAATAEPLTDFKQRFEELKRELDDLKQQYRGISTESKSIR
jgi:mono/diheme cytochrome c family protein